MFCPSHQVNTHSHSVTAAKETDVTITEGSDFNLIIFGHKDNKRGTECLHPRRRLSSCLMSCSESHSPAEAQVHVTRCENTAIVQSLAEELKSRLHSPGGGEAVCSCLIHSLMYFNVSQYPSRRTQHRILFQTD